jgi:hypothetical protein
VTRALALLLLAGCGTSLHDDLSGVRAEIRELQARIPPEAPLWIFEGPDRFDRFTEDGADSVPGHVRDHVLWRLTSGPEPVAEGSFDWDAARRDPAAFRGKAWRFGGVIGDLRPEPVGDARHRVPAAHAGACFDERLRLHLFHVAEKPEVLTLREDSVVLTALFVQWVEIETRSGRRVSAPYFLGRHVRRTL